MGKLRVLVGVLVCLSLFGPAVQAGPFRMMGHDTAAMGQGAGEVAWGHGLGVVRALCLAFSRATTSSVISIRGRK